MIRSVSLAAILAAAFALPALAQNSTTKSPPAAAVEAVAPLKLTEAQAKSWVDKQVYSSDGTKIGEIAAFARGTDNTVSEMHIDIGGFLGMGETRVRLMPAQFKLEGDRAVLNVTAAQAKDLPKVSK
jgi:PRC-barrel domain